MAASTSSIPANLNLLRFARRQATNLVVAINSIIHEAG